MIRKKIVSVENHYYFSKIGCEQ